MDFDRRIDRIGTHSMKWDMLGPLYDLSPESALPMWVADMDFPAPDCVRRTIARMAEHGIFGYFGDDRAYNHAIRWWMEARHGWKVEPDHILTTHGLVNGTGLVIDTFTSPGEGVIVMSPVYHAFMRVIRAAGRKVIECPLTMVDGRYRMDFDLWDSLMTGQERMLLLCSPHNPGGRVWNEAELQETAAFCRRHDLILVSDEIHHDLIMPGNRHRVMAKAVPDCPDRLIMMTSPSKTFNIAGSHTGNVIIPDPVLRKRLANRLAALGISPSSFGPMAVTAAYSPEGAAWLDELLIYLDGNRRLFDDALNALPGIRSMPLEATYLAWVDFADTGLTPEQIITRVERHARIATSHGALFGKGGEHFLRFNLASPRSMIEEATERLTKAFADL